VPRSVPAAAAATPVPRVNISAMSPQVFEKQFRACSRPVIIEGALPKEEWRLERFVALLGADTEIGCRIHGNDGHALAPERWRHKKSHAKHVVQTTARKFADSIASGVAAAEDCYVQSDIRNSEAGQRLGAALAAVGAATGLRLHEEYGAIINAWWGPPGHTEPLHIDVTDGTLCQLRGSKEVALFPAAAWADLYPFPVSGGMSWAFSEAAGLERPDFERHPRLRAALRSRMQVMLRPGDVLYIPACCAHEIRGLADDGVEHVLSVNRFWRTHHSRVTPHLPADAAASAVATRLVRVDAE